MFPLHTSDLTMPNLSLLGKLCGSSHSDDMIIQDQVKRKNSVRRMSIIEDGKVAEVLYLIPKQSMMEQLPFLDPSEYVILEKMSLPDRGAGKRACTWKIRNVQFQKKKAMLNIHFSRFNRQ